jgi:hypothetical protein
MDLPAEMGGRQQNQTNFHFYSPWIFGLRMHIYPSPNLHHFNHPHAIPFFDPLDRFPDTYVFP